MGFAVMKAPILYHDRARRSNASRRSFTLSEQYPAHLTCPLTLEQIKGVVEWLDVENSARWQPKGSATYCNVYAHDLLHILGFYLPRVWWKDPESVTSETKAIYGQTVREMSANSLHDWLIKYGQKFGWAIVDYGKDVQASQLRVYLNARNTYGVISSKRVGGKGSGHITLAFPDATNPIEGEGCLQSQAGTYNKRWFKDDKWYRSSRFESTVIAYHKGV